MQKRLKKNQPEIHSKLIQLPSPPKINYDVQTPIFSFRYMEENYSILKCEKGEKTSFVDKMTKISRCSWRDLKLSQKYGLGFEKIPREALRVSIPNKITQDVTFIAFRFYNKAPMVGFRDKDVFHIVWFDRNYEIYQH